MPILRVRWALFRNRRRKGDIPGRPKLKRLKTVVGKCVLINLEKPDRYIRIFRLVNKNVDLLQPRLQIEMSPGQLLGDFVFAFHVNRSFPENHSSISV